MVEFEFLENLEGGSGVNISLSARSTLVVPHLGMLRSVLIRGLHTVLGS